LVGRVPILHPTLLKQISVISCDKYRVKRYGDKTPPCLVPLISNVFI